MAVYEAQPGGLTSSEELPSWTFDSRRTEASFCARRMGRTWVNGRFKDVHGKFYLDIDAPRTSSCFGEIDVAKLYAGEPYLNTQLRTADFLDVEDHRKITFAARLAGGTIDTDFTAEVLLTLRGVTRLVIMDVTYLGEWKAPFWRDGENKGTATRMGLRAEGRINPSAFGMLQENPSGGGGEIIGANVIEIALDIEAALDTDLEAIGAIDL
ncbi:MAG TPA: YceI family protein [Solirubrobacteraceae bacterium]|jgi:polyisoprenoid-binding protein YceI|nr:YceI family protein [Solirubrobacteraceae bacterium]